MTAAPRPRPVALVTGSSRGIGLEIARQLGRLEMTVVVAARDAARIEAAAERLRAEGLDAVATRLDLTDAASVEAAARFVRERFGRLDVLVNNAGAAFDWTPEPTHPSAVDAATLRRTFETNVFGPLALTQALLPLLRESPRGRVVNVSSKIGSIDEIGRPDSPFASTIAPAYQASKTALNAFTALLAKELSGTRVKVNSACPGWVDTDGGVPPWLRSVLGGNGGAAPVEQGADTPVWLATLPEDGPSGGFFQGRKPIAW
jgi:NAD(P)-dependent dehydrogenase (short-subunit alcohol dehydrogenase family)